jgi:hypothetical protein
MEVCSSVSGSADVSKQHSASILPPSGIHFNFQGGGIVSPCNVSTHMLDCKMS